MHAEMIAWPRLIPGEALSPAAFGPWLTPSQLLQQGFTAWCVLNASGEPFAWGFTQSKTVLEVLSEWGDRVPVGELLALERALQRALGERGWRNERFGLIGADGQRSQDPRMALERSLFRRLGLLSESVQLNLQASDQAWWTARRALTKAVDPGLLDACVAGGLAAHEEPITALFREAGEEAGLTVAQTSKARVLGQVRVFRVLAEGLLIERVWAFGLRASEGCRPRPVDGEVSGFEQMTLAAIESSWRAGGFNHEAAVASLCFKPQ